MTKYYAGIGSRSTPPEILAEMTRLGVALASRQYVLRSGRAVGADRAFEAGCDRIDVNLKQIWTPKYLAISQEAYDLAATIHPAWPACSDYAKACHARNCYQVLGETLDQPVEFVVCWTRCGSATEEAIRYEDGSGLRRTGGTRTAILLALQRGIPVYNLADKTTIASLSWFE